mmetsp:Transcript_27404/g.60686  ORF Transcript_27404/g.60686 Transcript_27404/m.60686 type:complete len:242 (-) Transcript_27404:1765-2490(-)
MAVSGGAVSAAGARVSERVKSELAPPAPPSSWSESSKSRVCRRFERTSLLPMSYRASERPSEPPRCLDIRTEAEVSSWLDCLPTSRPIARRIPTAVSSFWRCFTALSTIPGPPLTAKSAAFSLKCFIAPVGESIAIKLFFDSSSADTFEGRLFVGATLALRLLTFSISGESNLANNLSTMSSEVTGVGFSLSSGCPSSSTCAKEQKSSPVSGRMQETQSLIKAMATFLCACLPVVLEGKRQ